jgi:tripartite-type tricarboxylate transporter receptor subunit TctC
MTFHLHIARWRSATRAVAAALGLFLLAAASAQAQDYPSRPLKLVVPFGAGGAVDVVARMLGTELAKRLGQPVIVENRTGAGGNIAASFVAKSDPDGYTLLMGSTGNSVNGSLYSNLNYNPDKDLMPLALVGQVPTVLLAHPSVPASTLPELLALAKGGSARLNLAHGGAGTTEHLAAELFNARSGLKLPVVPYRGGAPAMNDLLGGHVQLFFTNQLNALPYLKSGALKAIAIAAGERSQSLPNVPTFAEQGVPDFVVSVWWGVFGPANLPAPVVKKLNDAVNASLNSPEVIARLAAVGATPLAGSPEQFGAFYAREASKWGGVVRAANIKPE